MFLKSYVILALFFVRGLLYKDEVEGEGFREMSRLNIVYYHMASRKIFTLIFHEYKLDITQLINSSTGTAVYIAVYLLVISHYIITQFKTAI